MACLPGPLLCFCRPSCCSQCAALQVCYVLHCIHCAQYLEALGVSRSQVVPFDASKVYCAGEQLVTSRAPVYQLIKHCTQRTCRRQLPAAVFRLRPCRPHPAADRLLVPTPTPRITPPREGLMAVRRGLGVRTLPEVRWLQQSGRPDC